MSEEHKDIQQVAWNLSQSEIYLIAEVEREAMRKFLGGDIMGCFFSSQEINLLIHNSLNDDERKEMKEIENEVIKAWNRYHQLKRERPFEGFDDTPDEKTKEIMRQKSIHVKSVRKYRERLREFMDKYGYLISKKEDREKLSF